MINNLDPCDKGDKHVWKYLTKSTSYVRCIYCKEIRKINLAKNIIPEQILVPKSNLTMDKINNHFIIIITEYNSEKWIKQSIESVLNQTYKNYELLVIDDCSTDNTAKIIKTLNVPYIINNKQEGKIANLVKGWKKISTNPEDILVELDGDDWLANNEVLSYLNNIYQDNNIWFTYGQLEDLAHRIPPNFSKPLEDTKNFRKNFKAGVWNTLSLRTYKMKVLNHIKDEDFKDKNGNYYMYSQDVSLVLPTLEICGIDRIKCLDKVLYIYNNLSPINEDKINFEKGLQTVNEIKNKSSYFEIPKEPIASIIMPTFKRPNLLKWGLFTLSQQKTIYPFEIIVLNDGIKDETETICNSYKDKLNIKYIFTGQRNEKTDHWRVPGYAINIGVKKAIGKIIILMCPEIFLLDNCLTKMIEPILKNTKLITITEGQWDGKNIFLPYVEKNKGILDNTHPYNQIGHKLQTTLPFFMGINKEKFISIGGYDEDFIGVGWDDNDISERLQANGGIFTLIGTRIVHLYHPSTELRVDRDPTVKKAFNFNTNLYQKRKGIILRNQGCAWGELNNRPPILIWELNKIPKIAHFYWGNPTLPFLNYLTLYSFHKFNPDWEIRLYTSPKYCEVRSWNTDENKHSFKGEDYTHLLKTIPIKYITFDFTKINRTNNISEVHKSELLKQYVLSTIGGLFSDMDIIYFNSLSYLNINKEENKKIDTIISLHPNYRYKHSIGFLFSSPNNEYAKYLSEKQKTIPAGNYQCFGVELINQEFPTLESIKEKFPNLNPIDMAKKTVYAYDAIDISQIYISNDMTKYDSTSIGLHWYGGYPLSEKYINEVTDFSYKNYNNVLGKTIRKVYEE